MTQDKIPLFHRLPSWLRLTAQGALWCFWCVYFSFILLILVLRYSILPNIENYRPAIERLASQELGQTVSIGRIEASWQGINPDLTLFDVQVHDQAGRPALAFSRVEAILSWWTLSAAQLRLRLLAIDQPTLNLRRDAEGRFFVAGMQLGAAQEGNDDFSKWLLAQWRVRIRKATLVWEDELRKAAPLTLTQVNFSLDNDGRRHRFGMTALPPEALASRIDLRGDFRGTSFKWLDGSSGTLFTELDHVDLAAWRQWVDYPLALPHGRGALRAWVGFSGGAPSEITADLLLADASIRLSQELPALELQSLSGRLGVRFLPQGYAVSGRHLALESVSENESVHIKPTDFQVECLLDKEGRIASGKATANQLDLTMLSRLAARFPLDSRSRQLLDDYAPHGRVSHLTASWKADAGQLKTYALKTDFERLSLSAQGNVPGFSGLSGKIDANEKGGNLSLNAQASSIDLPAVFPKSSAEPHIRLNTLNAQARWTLGQEGLKAELQKLDFAGPEAAGSAQGIYRHTGQGPGEIDLTATLNRADARAVWRYLPHTVGNGSRFWLRDSLLSGRASEAKLTLKGNLADFPFLDKRKGKFLVAIKAHDAVIDYAKGWPRIEGIHGDVRFEGLGMVVEAQRGSILGTKVSKTRVEIPDMEIDVPVLHVDGQVDGPTAEFLKFIDKSPVAKRIDRFTEDMRASGSGHLDLQLKIPLAEEKLDETKIEGTFRLKNNEVTVDAALPPIRQVNGSVQFSGSDLRVPEITGKLFGGPLTIKGGLQKDGRVLITADGAINIEQLRKESASPLLAHLSGGTPYRGEVRINKRNADLVVETEFIGLESRLPEPFGKSGLETLPLRFEKKILAVTDNARGSKSVREGLPARDQISASLGKLLAAQFIRRRQGDDFVIERGNIAIGRPLQLPDKGLTLAMTGKRLDLDAWRKVFRTDSKTAPAATESAPDFLPDMLSLRTGELLLFGRRLNDVELNVQPRPRQWRLRLASRQASGDLAWDTVGRGKLTARLQRMKIESAGNGKANDIPESDESLQELPALDVIAEDFQWGERRFGRLELLATNEGGHWKLGKILLANPFGQLNGSGEWQSGAGKNQTQLDFRIESTDTGKLLDRLGYVGALKETTAKLQGELRWKGSPSAFQLASLNGEMKLETEKGQFLKLDPGAGKLLGLLSLQSLPRRITLDFRDVFSEGFVFDSIKSRLKIDNGIMRTDKLQIDGVAAKVLMRGETDLKKETQRLTVTVQPELGGTAALGVALVNPLAGVATLLAHKMLQNPLNQIFGFNYLVTGTWDDPDVQKLKQSEWQGTDVSPRLPANPHGETGE